MPDPILAAAQTVPICGDVTANIDEHLSLIATAADKDVSLVVFPELSLTGYEQQLAAELAFTSDDTRVNPLREAAATHGMTIVAGAPIRIEAKLHIGCFILHPDRNVEVYTKCYLHESEQQVFDAGVCNPLIHSGDRTAAIAICADANVYLVSAFFMTSGFAADLDRLRRYAVDHSMTVVLANFGGDSGGHETAGGSAIWNSAGTLVGSMDGKGVGLVVAGGTSIDE